MTTISQLANAGSGSSAGKAVLIFQQQSMIFLSKMEIGYFKKKKKAVVSVAAPLVEVLNEGKGPPSRTRRYKERPSSLSAGT